MHQFVFDFNDFAAAHTAGRRFERRGRQSRPFRVLRHHPAPELRDQLRRPRNTVEESENHSAAIQTKRYTHIFN